MMVEEPDSENSLFSEPMKIRTPSARSARPSRSITPRLVSRSSNSEPHALEILQRMQIFEQIGVAAHDQLPVVVVAAGPARDAGRDHLLRQLIELGAALRQARFRVRAALRPACGRESAH